MTDDSHDRTNPEHHQGVLYKNVYSFLPKPRIGNMQILVWKLLMHTADYHSFTPAAGP